MHPPMQTLHVHLWQLANTSHLIILSGETPDLLRREVRKFYRRLKKRLPPEAL
jgi:hypothetical protein